MTDPVVTAFRFRIGEAQERCNAALDDQERLEAAYAVYTGQAYEGSVDDQPLPYRTQVWAWRCERCDHVWLPQHGRSGDIPKSCARCKSRSWNVPRVGPKRVRRNPEAGQVVASTGLDV